MAFEIQNMQGSTRMQMNAFQQDRDLSDKIDPVFSSGE